MWSLWARAHGEYLPRLVITCLTIRANINHIPDQHGQKFGDIEDAVAIEINPVDHILEFSLCRILAQGTHDGAEVLGGDFSISIFTEQGKGHFELWGGFNAEICGQRVDRAPMAYSGQPSKLKTGRTSLENTNQECESG